MKTSRLVVNLIILCVIPYCVEGLNCTTTEGGICSQITKSCYTDNTDFQGLCPSTVHTGQPSNYDYPFDDSCPVDYNGVGHYVGPPHNVYVDVYPYNNELFAINVSWDQVTDTLGYYVHVSIRTFNGERNPPKRGGCKGISGTTQTSHIFHLEYSYILAYSNCNNLRYLEFQVTTTKTSSSNNYGFGATYWPTNCYNFTGIPINDLYSICGPATPAKINQVIMTHKEDQFNSSQVQLQFQWEEPVDTPPNYPLTYYLYFRFLSVSFRIRNTTSITVGPLNRNFTYSFILQAFQPYTCSFFRYCANDYGCSFEKRWTYFVDSGIYSSSPSPIITTTYDVIPSSTYIRHDISSTVVVHTNTLTAVSNTPAVVGDGTNSRSGQSYTVVASVGGSVVLLLIGVIIIALIMLGIGCTRPPSRPHFEPSSLPSSPPPSPRPSDTSEDEGSGRNTPISPASITTSVSFDIFSYDAIIVDSKSTPDIDRQALLLFLTDRSHLGNYGIQVGYLDRHALITPAEWLQNMQSVPRILCVCNEHFYREWTEQTPGTLVAALRALVNAVVHSQPSSLSSRFVVILLDERDDVYIPEFLKGVLKFLVTDTDNLAHNIKNVKEFDLVSHCSSVIK